MKDRLIEKLKELIVFLNAVIISGYRDDKEEQIILNEIIALESEIKQEQIEPSKMLTDKGIYFDETDDEFLPNI